MSQLVFVPLSLTVFQKGLPNHHILFYVLHSVPTFFFGNQEFYFIFAKAIGKTVKVNDSQSRNTEGRIHKEWIVNHLQLLSALLQGPNQKRY